MELGASVTLLKKPSDGHKYLTPSRRHASSDRVLASPDNAGLDDAIGSSRHDIAEKDGLRGAAYHAELRMITRTWSEGRRPARVSNICDETCSLLIDNCLTGKTEDAFGK